jgi:TRAP-type C4-dicarboxylate transport system permease small subunit
MPPSDPVRLPLPQQSWVRAIRVTTEALTVLTVAAFVVLIVLQVFFRFVLNSSITWSEEAVQFLLLWSVMLGSAVASDRQAHIALDPLRERFGPKGFRILQIVAGTCTLALCGILVFYAIRFIQRVGAMTASATDLPMSYVYAAMPVGALLIGFFTLIHMIAGTEAPDLRIDETS